MKIDSQLALLILCILLPLLTGCDKSDESAPTATLLDKAEISSDKGNKNELLHTLISTASSTFEALSNQCSALTNSITLYTKTPSQQTLNASINAWEICHDHYLSTRLFRVLIEELNIFHPELDPNSENNNINSDPIHTNHIRIDQYPMLPGYIDSVPGYPYSGLIHSEIELTETSLNSEHQLSDSAYVALGYHAIELMLKGTGKTLEEQLKGYQFNGIKEHDYAVKRRKKYLQLLSQILNNDLHKLIKEWISNNAFYPRQLRLVSHERLRSTLDNLSSVEGLAIHKIRETMKGSPENVVHDTARSLTLREDIATQIKDLLQQKDKPESHDTGSSGK